MECTAGVGDMLVAAWCQLRKAMHGLCECALYIDCTAQADFILRRTLLGYFHFEACLHFSVDAALFGVSHYTQRKD